MDDRPLGDDLLRVTLLLVPALLTACSTLGISTGNDGSFILNERLAEAYGNPEYTLGRGRAPLVMRTGRSVDNCQAYLDAGGYPNVAADVNSRITPAQYLVCDTLPVLADSRPLTEGDYRPEDYGEALRDRLDLRSFESSAQSRVTADAYTIDGLEGVRTALTKHGVVTDARDWILQLRVVAVGHVDGNSQPDWLVWMHDESNAGLYRAHRLLIVHDAEGDGLLRATPHRP